MSSPRNCCSFNFLQLPTLVQLEVVGQLEFYDLLSLSLVSKKTKRIVKTCKFQIPCFKWFLGELHLNYHIWLLDEKRNSLLALDTEMTDKIMADLEKLKLQGTLVPMARCSKDKKWVVGLTENIGNASQVLPLFEEVTKYILEVFKVQNFELEVFDSLDTHLEFVAKYTNTFRFLYSNVQDPNDLKVFFEDLQIQKLHLDSTITGDYKYVGPLKMDHLSVDDGHWISIEALLNMECRVLKLERDSLTNIELNKFVKHWLSGELNTLESFLCWSKTSKDQDQILEGIEHFPWNPKNRPETFKFFELENGRDIRRKDGLLATVSVKICEFHSEVRLFVWKEKYLLDVN